MTRTDVAYGVALDDAPAGYTEHQAVTGVTAPTAVQTYPNPCGTWCDIGNLRDVWWAAVWIAAMAFVIGSGVHTAATATFETPSTGEATVSIDQIAGFSSLTATTDFSCYALGLKYIVMGCNSGSFYIGAYSNCPDGSRSKLQEYLRDQVKAGKSNVAKVPSVPKFSVTLDGTDYSVSSNTCKKDELLPDLQEAKTYGRLAFAVFLAVVIGIGMLCLMRAVPRETIIVSNIVMAILYFAAAGFFIIKKVYVAAVLFAVCALIGLLFLALAWKRIPFAAMCLQMSSHVVLNYWGTLITAMITLFIHAAFIVTWLFSARNLDRFETSNPLLWALILILYWGTEVFRNVVHVTTSGVTSDWFFSLGGPGTPAEFQGARRESGVTLGAAKRAAVWSLGSICFGSLIVAIIRTVRTVLRLSMRHGGIIKCLVLCLLACIESLMRYFNDYAFVQVAMFGKPYITAAKDTWTLVKNGTGWDAIINDSLVDWVFSMMTINGGVLVGFASYFVGGKSWSWFFVGLIIGFIVVSIVMRQVYSGVMTVFIGFWQVCLQHAHTRGLFLLFLFFDKTFFCTHHPFPQLQSQGVTWQAPSIGTYTPEVAPQIKSCYDTPPEQEEE